MLSFLQKRNQAPFIKIGHVADDHSCVLSPIIALLMAGYMDPDSAALVAELVLQDIQNIASTHEGKSRYGAPPSDEEIAFQVQADNARMILSDFRLAQSIDRALDSDAALIIAAHAAEDDYRYATALEREEEPPEQSEWQRLMENHALANSWVNSGRVQVALLTGSTRIGATVRAHEPETGAMVFGPVGAGSSQGLRTACIICADRIYINVSVRAPCQHYYCHDCIRDLIRACTTDESLYPPRCCNQPFEERVFFPILSLQLRTTFQSKSREFNTLALHRVYCPTPTCSIFLGSSENSHGRIYCSSCYILVCTRCKQRAHPGPHCPEDTATIAVRELAEAQQWQTCPGCRDVIELNTGCFHMTCRCRTQFCYLCAELWKNCACPQWDEDRLVEVAHRRVADEMGEQAQAVRPFVFMRNVQQRVEELRNNHDCDGHWWHRRNGGAICEECNDYLPQFILVSRLSISVGVSCLIPKLGLRKLSIVGVCSLL